MHWDHASRRGTASRTAAVLQVSKRKASAWGGAVCLRHEAVQRTQAPTAVLLTRGEAGAGELDVPGGRVVSVGCTPQKQRGVRTDAVEFGPQVRNTHSLRHMVLRHTKAERLCWSAVHVCVQQIAFSDIVCRSPF